MIFNFLLQNKYHNISTSILSQERLQMKEEVLTFQKYFHAEK